jgi:hypothetical protein
MVEQALLDKTLRRFKLTNPAPDFDMHKASFTFSRVTEQHTAAVSDCMSKARLVSEVPLFSTGEVGNENHIQWPTGA